MPKTQRSPQTDRIETASADWRCTCCGKLMGRRAGSVVLIQFARGHRYRAPRPVSAVCRACGTLNET